jgi:hypothetical protein
VGLAIWHTSKVLVPPLTIPALLGTPSMEKLRQIIEAAPADFFGVTASRINDLLRHRTIAANLSQQVETEQNPERRDKLEVQLSRALANVERADPYVRWLLATAHVWQIREALRRAHWYTMLGVVLVAVGAAALFSVTGRETIYVPVVTPQITVVPTANGG